MSTGACASGTAPALVVQTQQMINALDYAMVDLPQHGEHIKEILEKISGMQEEVCCI